MSLLSSPPTLVAVPCLQPPHPLHSPSSSRLRPKHNLNSCITPITMQNPNPALQHHWPHLLQISIGSGDVRLGLAIHGFLVKTAPELDAFQGNNLINMYAKLHRLDDAHRVLDDMPVRNTITWTTLINGYASIKESTSVVRVSRQMHRSGEKFNGHTCTVVLQACMSPKERELIVGEQVQGMAIKIGADSNVFVGTSLVSMYARSGRVEDAELVFSEMVDTDIRCFNSLILEYAKLANGGKAIRAFCYLRESGLEPDDYTFTNVVSGCHGDVGADEGRQLHGLAIKYGVICELSVGNAITTMYGRHLLVEEAEKMFVEMKERNLVSWTAVLSAYVKSGSVERAIYGFLEMLHLGVGYDSSCLSTVLDACSQYKDAVCVLQVHGSIIKLGYHSDVFVGTALVDAYAKCGTLSEARLVLDKLSNRTVASFNAILSGYMQTAGPEEDAMVLLHRLRSSGMEPDEVTITQLLSLSANQASVVRGESLHGYAIKTGLGEDVNVGNAVISMYAKCGCIRDTSQKFRTMINRDRVTWNAMISAHALHGQGEEALLLFEAMIRVGIQPDETTLVSTLQACSYSGLLEDGIEIFKCMEQNYGVKPQLDHQVCMVDLLGRAGDLAGAMEFIEGSEFKGSSLLWRTLVNACKLRGDLNFGTLASKRLLDLVSDDAASFVLVSNMYSEGGRLEEAAKVRVVMKDGNLRKEVGCSWIEVGGRVHRFTASGKAHLKNREVYEKLNQLTGVLKGCSDASTEDKLFSISGPAS